MVLGHDAAGVSDDEIWETLVNEYHEKFGMTWIGLYGFNNTYTTVVTSEAAEKYNLVTTSDLASAAGELTLAAIRIIWSGQTDLKSCAIPMVWNLAR